MRPSIIPAGILLMLLLLAAVPAADAACNRTPPVIVTMTINYPPGPWGTINVETSPSGAQVYLNGVDKGVSPVTVSGVWQGTYTITAKIPGYQDYTTTTTVSGPFESNIYCSLVPDSTGTGVYFTSTPSGADVYIDGDKRGKTPLMLKNAGTGTHEILMKHSGYADWKKTVSLLSTGTTVVSASLLETGINTDQGLNITSDPPGATIVFDGREKGFTPMTLNTISPGIHILELQYSGYTPWKSTVDVPETTIREIRVNLTPDAAIAPGWIRVRSDPPESSVMLDGTYAGRTAAGTFLNLDAKPPGEYTLVVSHAGYKPYTTRVVVLPGNVSEVDATLVPVISPSARGNLSVATDPAGASVIIDNSTIGTSPLSDYQLTAGDHHVTIRMEGYTDYSADIRIPAEESSAISVALTKAPAGVYSPLSPFTLLCALLLGTGIALRRYR